MIEAKKPIVGHNLAYDVFYLYQQFIDDLPEDYETFIKEWTKLFPSTYDTKVMSYKSRLFNNTALDAIYHDCIVKSLINNSTTKVNYSVAMCKYRNTKLADNHHEAGFDAHMTGYAFVKIALYMQ